MKKKYFKPEVQSDDMFEQTANRTGVNLDFSSCTIPNESNPKDCGDGFIGEFKCIDFPPGAGDECAFFPGDGDQCIG